ncbi:MAG: DUF2846 domain-containing protein [Thiohalophilus sp.]|jgi:hypothetical protein
MLKILRNFSLLILSLTLVACASVPMESPEQDMAAKNARPGPNESLIYVYRHETFGAAVKLALTLDDKLVGETASKTYLLLKVPPGKHTLASQAEGAWDKLIIECKAGKTYYVWQEVKMGMFAANSKLHLMDPKEGREGLDQCKLIKQQ